MTHVKVITDVEGAIINPLFYYPNVPKPNERAREFLALNGFTHSNQTGREARARKRFDLHSAVLRKTQQLQDIFLEMKDLVEEWAVNEMAVAVDQDVANQVLRCSLVLSSLLTFMNRWQT